MYQAQLYSNILLVPIETAVLQFLIEDWTHVYPHKTQEGKG